MDRGERRHRRGRAVARARRLARDFRVPPEALRGEHAPLGHCGNKGCSLCNWDRAEKRATRRGERQNNARNDRGVEE